MRNKARAIYLLLHTSFFCNCFIKYGEVQVELADEWYDADRARAWRAAGVQHVIVKRSRDREAAGDLYENSRHIWGKSRQPGRDRP